MKAKRLRLTLAAAMVLLFLGLVSCASNLSSKPESSSEIQEQRASVRDMAAQTLAQLYQQYPGAQVRVKNAAGYAVFSDFGIKFLYMGSATGHGLVFSNATKQETFMKMVELQPGFGFGAQKFKVVFLFDTQDVLNTFVNSGWEFGGSAAAGAQTSTQGGGGALGTVVSPGTTMYQLSGEGAILGISITGAKFYKNEALNSAPPEGTSATSVGKYYYFDDVLIPKDLEYDAKKSYVYETPQFKAGALYFTKWRVDTNSLFDFFLIHMERDGWKMVTSYRGKESFLTLYKPDRGCTIRITESWLGEAHVEIRVGPADVKRK